MLTKNRRKDSFDIMIPVYNYAQFFPKAVRSVLKQTFTNFRIIIMDNCSTDNTEEVAQELMKNDSRILYVKNEKNLGITGNFNRCLETSEAEFVLILGGDDMLRKTFLEETYKIIKSDPKIKVVMTRIANIDENGKLIKLSSHFYQAIPSSYIKKEDLYYKGIMSTPSACVYVNPEINFDINLRFSFDVEYLLHILFQGGKIYFLNKILVFFRFHTMSQGHLIKLNRRYYEELSVEHKYVKNSANYNDIVMHKLIRYANAYFLINDFNKSRIHLFQALQYSSAALKELYFWKMLILNGLQSSCFFLPKNKQEKKCPILKILENTPGFRKIIRFLKN